MPGRHRKQRNDLHEFNLLAKYLKSRVGASMGQRDREVHNVSELSWGLGLLLLLLLLLSLTD